ncbi:MAG: hypothetical protein ED559_07325 [Phycisphaera sp.]|nr:MAG: hypothetical protein ED559_07325 [Phycisphaera sp.]
MQAKPVQIAVIVIGLLVGVVGIVLATSGGGGADLANRMVLIDVKTGDVYSVSLQGRSVRLPYPHPDTSESTLLPASLDEDTNTWYLSNRYLKALENIEGISDKVDTESGKVDIPADTKPQSID